MPQVAGCPLCDAAGGAVVFQGPRFRVIRAEEAGFPAFYRLVWLDHVAEFSDLSAADRQDCMEAVVRIEQALRAHLSPTKVNVASLGNAVPHLHWHVIARFDWDSHFPGAVWASAQREAPPAHLHAVTAVLPEVEAAISHALSSGPGNCTGS
jgi:diadenosine tetraphosphate (Ap4A) HIT family hydrolase